MKRTDLRHNHLTLALWELRPGTGRPGCSPPRASPYARVGTITFRRKTQTTVPSWL